MSNYLDDILSGNSGFSKIAVAFTQPAVGSNVSVQVGATNWAVVGAGVNVAVGGAYLIVTVVSATQLILKNSGGAGNAAPGTLVPAAGVIAPGGTPGTAGAGVIPAVDIVATSNIVSLTGVQTIDGVSTSGKRILLAAQTSSVANGPYTCGTGGAWVSDFSTDAQVLAALGQSVYVKAGGTTGGDTNWQLKTGATLAGAKTYARATGVNVIAPVDYVQQFALGWITDPAWVYSSGPKTLTAAVNGAIRSDIFGTANIVGKRLEVNYAGVADTRAGIYVGVSNGSVSTPASMVRASDFNTTPALADGARYLVSSGVASGTQRAMITVAPTLDTTPILMDRVRPAGTLEIDLSAPPYNIRDYHSYLEWVFGGAAIDNGPIISQFLADYVGTGAVGKLPAANGGLIVCRTPILYVDGGPVLKGAGKRSSTIKGLMGGGPLILAQKLTPPQLSAFALDTAANSTAISFDVDTNGNAARPYWLNLTHAGVIVDSWANFEYTATHRWSPGVGGAVSSCRGTRQAPNSGIGSTVQDPLDTLFSLDYSGGAQQLTAKLRVWDQTKGVYGAVTHTGTGTSVMTGDGTIKPNADAPIVVRVVTGGTIGVAGIVLQFSNNAESGVGVTWSTTFALGTATSITINHPTIHLEQGTWKFNFSAGTMVAGDTYYSNCTGTLQTVTIVSDPTKPVTPNTNYLVTVQYDGANARMYVSKPGLARDTGTNVTNVPVTGVVRQYPWEDWVIGTSQNGGMAEGADGVPAGPMYFASVSILSASVAVPPSTTPTTLTRSGAERFFFQPTTANAIKSPDGVLRAWHGFNKAVDSVVVPRSNYPAVRLQMSLGGFEDFGTDMGNVFSTNLMGMGLLSVAWNQRCFRNLLFSGGLHGWCNRGPDFFSDDYDLSYNVTWGPAYTSSACGQVWHGTHQFINCGGPMLVAMYAGALVSHGTIDINCEIPSGAVNLCDYGTLAPFVAYALDGNISDISVDPENQVFGYQGRELMCLSVTTSLKIANGFAALDFSKYAFLSLASSSFNGEVHLDRVVLEAGSSTLPNTSVGHAFTIRDVRAAPIKLGSAFVTAGKNFNSLCDRPGFVRKVGGALPATALANVNATLLYTDPNPAFAAFVGTVRNTYFMPAGTINANRTLTLSTVDMQESDCHRVTLGVQTNTVAFVNGGPAGGTLVTAPVGFMGTLTFRLNQAGNLEWI